MNSPQPKDVPRWWYLAALVAVLVLWSGVTAIVFFAYGKQPSESGPFGDTFGAVNALFTGLAFVGVVATFIKQIEQARRTEEQAQLAAKDNARMREAFSKSAYAAAFKTASDILQSAQARDARRIVITGVQNPNFKEWTQAQKNAAEIVCHTYDQVGILVRYGLLPAEYIADSWGDSLRKCWNSCKPMVLAYREQRGSFEFWDDFEFLALESTKYHKKLPHG
jgi:hypothetical protein